jgi:hypothetical protein
MNAILPHTLFDLQSDNIFSISSSGKKVTIENGIIAKTKSSFKEFSDEKEALKFFEKKEWEMLKKGFVLRNEKPDLGQPTLHYYVGAGYTGSLSFAATPTEIYIYKHGWFKTVNDQKDFLTVIDVNGNLKDTIELPEVLAWDIQYNNFTNKLLLDLDHHIFEYDLDTKNFKQLIDRSKGKWASFVSCVNDKIVVGTDQNFQVLNNENRVLLQQKFNVEIVQGSIPFCASLSKNGKILALHNKLGEIQCIDTNDGRLLSTIVGDFQMIGQMEFLDNDKNLAIKEEYGVWKMRYFEIKTGTELNYVTIEIPAYSKDVNCFSFNADQSRLALIQRDMAYMFDFTNKLFLHSFKINHCVKTTKSHFVGEQLGFRTDYGCFSLYTV